MKQLLENLVESLREELKEYGGLLALLDQQQALVAARRAPNLLETVARVDRQAQVIRAARQEREQRRLHLARTLGQDDETSLTTLLRWLPADYQPLIQALVEENTELLARTQERARQNLMLLSRVVETMQRLMTNLSPRGIGGAYSYAGQKSELVPAEAQLYNAVG